MKFIYIYVYIGRDTHTLGVMDADATVGYHVTTLDPFLPLPYFDSCHAKSFSLTRDYLNCLTYVMLQTPLIVNFVISKILFCPLSLINVNMVLVRKVVGHFLSINISILLT